MRPWDTTDRRVLLSKPPFLTVEQHTVMLPSGQTIDDWTWVITPDYINVVAETEDGAFVFFRQTKYAADGIILAPVGGYMEPGEDPLAAAQRELHEETGYAADEWRSLGSYAVDGNRGAGTAHLFLARGARAVAERHADDLEEQELLLLSRDEVAAALRSGEFKVLPNAAAVALALLSL